MSAEYKVDKFEGGIADGYLAAAPNFSSVLDNLLIDENGKPYSRYGNFAMSTRVPTSGSSTRVSGIYLGSAPYGLPIVVRADKAYIANSALTTWTEITGPTGNPAFPRKLHTNYESAVEWAAQLIVASGETSGQASYQPMRMYCQTASDTSGTFESVTLGLPAMDGISLSSAGGSGSNFIYGAHFNFVFQDYDGNVYEEKGPVSVASLENVGAPSVNNITVSSIDTITNTTNDNWDTNTVAKTSIGTTSSSAVLTGFSSTSDIIEGMAISGTGIPAGSRVLSKTSTTVTMDRNATATASVTVTFYALCIYVHRTVANGEALYFLAAVPNGTTSYVDSTTDAVIQDRALIYTDGGLVDYNPPPLGSRYVCEVNGFFWYATERMITHSIQNSPGACPDEYYFVTSQKVKGLSNTNTFPILFCDRSVYRVDGVYDELGEGGFDLREISQTAGCVSNRSIVKIPEGIVWAGNGGFYYTNGEQVKRISYQLPVRYETWQNASMVGTYDSINNMVRWTISSSANNQTAPNDAIAVLHLAFGITDSTCVTTLSFGTNIYPTTLHHTVSDDATETLRSKMLMADARGYILYEDELSYTDPVIDNNVDPDDFTKRVIMYRLESIGLDLGSDSIRKYCTHVTAEFRNDTDIALQFFSRRDDGGPWASLSEMRADGAILWGISEYPWNGANDNQNHDWNSQPVVEGMRHFPVGTLRSTRRQVAITNAKTWITKSDDIGTVTTDTANKLITLNTAGSFWPGDCEDYEVTFANDSYTFGFIVRQRISDTVVKVYDPYGTLPSGNDLEWQMRGYRKFERLSLLSYTIWFDPEGATQAPSRGTTGLVNA